MITRVLVKCNKMCRVSSTSTITLVCQNNRVVIPFALSLYHQDQSSKQPSRHHQSSRGSSSNNNKRQGEDELKNVTRTIAQNQNLDQALEIYDTMKKESSLTVLLAAQVINLCIQKRQIQPLNSILTDVIHLLDNLTDKDKRYLGTFTWNAILSGLCIAKGRIPDALKVLGQMAEFSVKTNSKIITRLLNGCGNARLVDEALMVFRSMENKFGIKPDVYHFTCLLKTLVLSKRYKDTMMILNIMKNSAVEPSPVTFTTLLSNFADIGKPGLSLGREVHKLINASEFAQNVAVNNSLIHMYCKCGNVKEAMKVFQTMNKNDTDLITWNSLISGLAQYGLGNEALDLFNQMQQENVHLHPDEQTLGCVLNACGEAGLVDESLAIFNSMEDKFGVKPNIYHCTGLLKALVASKRTNEINTILKLMQNKGIEPNAVTFTTLLTVCAEKGSLGLEFGKELHKQVIESEIVPNVTLQTAIINMYCKCGSVDEGLSVFNSMKKGDRNIITWSSLIHGLGKHGRGREALNLFQQMQQEGIRPDNKVIGSVLNACSESGLVDEAYDIFHSISTKFNIKPNIYHANSLLKTVAESDRFNESKTVLELMKSLEIKPDVVTYNTLLAGCARVGNDGLAFGKEIHEQIIESGAIETPDLKKTLINMYCKCGSIEDAHTVFQSIDKNTMDERTYKMLATWLDQYKK